jgi:thiosulfate dehydrogenase [quinone] large subunit
MTSLAQHPAAATQTTANTTPSAGSSSVTEGSAPSRAAGYALGGLRIVVGWTFIWAFFDKLLALGYSTGRNPDTGVVDRFGADAWIHGGSPTAGFLGFAATGPFEGIYHSLAGTTFADWSFMFGLLAIGIAFTLGIATRLAMVAGAAMYLLMWSVVLPPASNPITDDHTIGLFVVLVLGLFGAGRYLGLGSWWSKLSIVNRFPILK